MPKFCKDHIVSENNPRLDLSLWLEDTYIKQELYKYSPEIIMGENTFAIFKSIVEGIELNPIYGTVAFTFKKYVIPQRWIIIDHHVDLHYIKISWEDMAGMAKIYNEDENNYFNKMVRRNVEGQVYQDAITAWHTFNMSSKLPFIKKVIYNNPATIILWSDHTKTVVQCQPGDYYDREKGLAMAIAKKALGNTSRKLNDVLHKWERKEEPFKNSCINCKYGDQKLTKKPCKSCDDSFCNWKKEE